MGSPKYDKENTKGLYLKLNVKTDEDIILWLDSQKNKQGAIKTLIREQIEREEKSND